MPRAKALDHVALVVTDLDRTVQFYQRVLGLELLRTSGPGADGVRSAVLRAGGQELNVFSRPEGAAGDEASRVGMHHFCFAVEATSADELVAALRRAGIASLRGPIDRRDGTSVFVHDPDGVEVELQLKKPVRDEIARFFDGFVEAFGSFTGARVASLYLVPGVAVRGDGSIQAVQSRADIERFFQTALDGYHRDGCRATRFKDLDVVPMGGRSVLGTVTWELLREDGSVLKEWRQSYNLARVEKGWQILASTYHLEEQQHG